MNENKLKLPVIGFDSGEEEEEEHWIFHDNLINCEIFKIFHIPSPSPSEL